MPTAREVVRRAALTLISVSLAAVAGALMAAVGMPLAWLLAPMLVVAAFTMSDRAPWIPEPVRMSGQLLIGVTIGLQVTGAILLATLPLLPVMIGAALVSVLMAATLSVGLARFGRIDERSAYYAMMPGGLTEMAITARAEGGVPEPIIVTHTLRITVVLLLIGLGAWFLPRTAPVAVAPGSIAWVPVGVALGAGALAAFIGRKVRLGNPWVIAPIFVVGGLSAGGVLTGTVPPAMLALGQFLVGITIGLRFRRERLLALPHFIGFALVATTILMLLSAGVGISLSRLIGIEWRTLVLAMAPGGVSEMSATAAALQLGVVTVSAFHLVRTLLVGSGAVAMQRALERAGYFRAVGRIVERVSERSD